MLMPGRKHVNNHLHGIIRAVERKPQQPNMNHDKCNHEAGEFYFICFPAAFPQLMRPQQICCNPWQPRLSRTQSMTCTYHDPSSCQFQTKSLFAICWNTITWLLLDLNLLQFAARSSQPHWTQAFFNASRGASHRFPNETTLHQRKLPKWLDAAEPIAMTAVAILQRSPKSRPTRLMEKSMMHLDGDMLRLNYDLPKFLLAISIRLYSDEIPWLDFVGKKERCQQIGGKTENAPLHAKCILQMFAQQEQVATASEASMQ